MAGKPKVKPGHKTYVCTICGVRKPVAQFRSRPFVSLGHTSQCSACDRDRLAKRHAAAKAEALKHDAKNDPHVRALLKLARNGPVNIELACNALDVSPRGLRAIVLALKARGAQVELEHGAIGIGLETTTHEVVPVRVAPTVGTRQKIAVISDTHLGSKYCLRAQLREFVEYAYAQGVREILHPGDVLDGDYRHARFEMSHVGLEDQILDLFETLPELPGLTYHSISGNHDHTFAAQSGVNVGRAIERYFAALGRGDWTHYGDRSAYLRIRGALVHLWHPRSGISYARSYALQKKIESYAPGEKPQILLAGHWHVYCHLYERGVQALACPTFQGGGSEFAKSLTGDPAIGGLILSWDLTDDGTMRAFAVEKRSYFEREARFDLPERRDGIEVSDPPTRDRLPRR